LFGGGRSIARKTSRENAIHPTLAAGLLHRLERAAHGLEAVQHRRLIIVMASKS
jgi:hypothetical protein